VSGKRKGRQLQTVAESKREGKRKHDAVCTEPPAGGKLAALPEKKRPAELDTHVTAAVFREKGKSNHIDARGRDVDTRPPWLV